MSPELGNISGWRIRLAYSVTAEATPIDVSNSVIHSELIFSLLQKMMFTEKRSR